MINNLQKDYQGLLENNPKIRAVEAAAQLGCSELDLLVLDWGVSVFGLQKQTILDFFYESAADYRFMSLMRNNEAVHECTTTTKSVDIKSSQEGWLISGAFSASIDCDRFEHIVLVHHHKKSMPKRSLQVFDASGKPIWKIYIKNHIDDFDSWISKYYLQNQPLPTSRNSKKNSRKDLKINDSWQIATADSYASLIHLGSEQQWNLGIEVFHSSGSQTSIIVPNEPVIMGPWFNIMQPHFNLHLMQEKVCHAYLYENFKNSHGVFYLNEEGQAIFQIFKNISHEDDFMEIWKCVV